MMRMKKDLSSHFHKWKANAIPVASLATSLQAVMRKANQSQNGPLTRPKKENTVTSPPSKCRLNPNCLKGQTQ
jgi:hypothetical protein